MFAVRADTPAPADEAGEPSTTPVTRVVISKGDDWVYTISSAIFNALCLLLNILLCVYIIRKRQQRMQKADGRCRRTQVCTHGCWNTQAIIIINIIKLNCRPKTQLFYGLGWPQAGPVLRLWRPVGRIYLGTKCELPNAIFPGAGWGKRGRGGGGGGSRKKSHPHHYLICTA